MTEIYDMFQISFRYDTEVCIENKSSLIGSGNVLVPSGNKPLPEPNDDLDLWHHMASLGHNELINHKYFYLGLFYRH